MKITKRVEMSMAFVITEVPSKLKPGGQTNYQETKMMN
jgi:hypothetical protein